MGRPKKQIDEDLVFHLASKGWTNIEIAAECGCSHDTIERRFADVIKQGHAVRNGNVRSKQYEVAMQGNATMLVWLGKNLLQQSDKVEHQGEVTVREAIDRGKHYIDGRSNGNTVSPRALPE